MFRILKSIRVKMTLWYALILLTTFGVFGFTTYTYLKGTLGENLDRSLTNEVIWVHNFIKPKADAVKPSKKYTSKKSKIEEQDVDSSQISFESPPVDPDDEIWNQIYEHALLNPRKTLIEVTDKKSNVIFRSYSVGTESLMVAEVAPNKLMLSTVRDEKGMEWRVASMSTDILRIYAAYPLQGLGEVVENLFFVFLILIPIALTVSIGGGWFLAGRSLRSVDEVTTTARLITAQNLEQKIPESDVNDEIGRLILTFNEMIDRLKQSFEQAKQFSIDASHELRTPLTIIRGEIELALRSSKTEEEYRILLSSILEETVRLSSIIENLMLLAKADRGIYEVQLEPVDFKKLVSELYEDTEILAYKKNIKVEFAYGHDVTVMGDRLRLRQLFLNLIDNAIKYTQEFGQITLTLERIEGFAKVSVKDNGPGIPFEEQSKIFDRFYRVDKARSRDLGGSGLGLSIVKWIVELHQGKIEVLSEVNSGSTFSVYIPVRY